VPGVETPGYSQEVPLGLHRIRFSTPLIF
jgi:hypothetical protein